MGYELLQLGYRPLRFRLALTHLFRNFSYKTGSRRYQPLLQALRALVATPSSIQDKAVDPPILDPRPMQRLLYASIFPSLIALVWHSPVHRSIDERRALAGDLLALVLENLKEHRAEMEDGMTGFWIGLLVHIIVNRAEASVPSQEEEHEQEDSPPSEVEDTASEVEDKRLSEALAWFTNAVTRNEQGERRKRIVRGIEDYVLDFLTSQAELFHARIPTPNEAEKPEERRAWDELLSRFMANFVRRMQDYLYPFFNSDLLNDFDPLLRRALGLLTRFDHEFKVLHLVMLPDQEHELAVEEDEEERFALQVIQDAMRGVPETADLVRADLMMQCTWNRWVPEGERAEYPDLPERHPVHIKVSLITLLLRDEVRNLPGLIGTILYQLQILDPTLGQDLFALQVALLSENEATRRRARERFAVSLLRSPYFELQRDLSHGVRRLCKMDTKRLEQFLAPPAGWLALDIPTPHIITLDNKEFPAAMLVGLKVLTFEPEALYDMAERDVESVLQQYEEGTSLSEPLTLISTLTTLMYSPLRMAFYLLQVLILSAQRDDKVTIMYEEQEWTPRAWIDNFLQQTLRRRSPASSEKPDKDVTPWRSPYLKAAHACVLRLAAHVAAASSHMQAWKEELENDEDVLCQWGHVTLALTERLFPLLVGRYGTEVELLTATEEAVRSLNIHYNNPANFPDRFNPFLLGPHFFDHEVAAVLHILTVFVQYNPQSDLALELEVLRALVEPWTNDIHSEAEVIYVQQQEHAMDTLGLQMPLSPRAAALSLLSVLPQAS